MSNWTDRDARRAAARSEYEHDFEDPITDGPHAVENAQRLGRQEIPA